MHKVLLSRHPPSALPKLRDIKIAVMRIFEAMPKEGLDVSLELLSILLGLAAGLALSILAKRQSLVLGYSLNALT